MAAKKSHKSKAPKGQPINKSQFIRDNSALSPQEIVAKAKSKGIELSPAMVYTIRSQAKTSKAKTTPAKGTKVQKAPASTQKSPSPPKGYEATFVQAIIELGAGRAEELFKATVAKVRALANRR